MLVDLIDIWQFRTNLRSLFLEKLVDRGLLFFVNLLFTEVFPSARHLHTPHLMLFGGEVFLDLNRECQCDEERS